ncbi:MAG: thiol:disulfide interchange protein, partial [Bacteroidota bacterium]|nr:thiol:disulfide interchange protein [Bacteroidota bacterium]
MRYSHLILVLSLFVQPNFAQILDPVHWTTEVKPLANNEYEIIFHAILDKGWSIYSQNNDPNVISPTEVTLEQNTQFVLLGGVEERGKLKKGAEPLFDNTILSKYMEKVDFVQRIKVLKPLKSLNASVFYMTCDDKQCLP